MLNPENLKGLVIDEIRPISTQFAPDGGLSVDWSCPGIGFGNLALWWGRDGLLHADTEHTASDEDKAFLIAVLSLVADQIIVDG